MMETKNLVGMILAVTVGLICIGTVMMPILSDASETEGTITNGYLYYMTDFTENDSVVYTFDGSVWTVDGEEIELPVSGETTVVAGEGFIIRSNGYIRGISITSPASITTMTVTSSGVTGEYVNPDSTTGTINIVATVYYCAVDDVTDYVLCPYNVSTYLNGDSEIFADGISGIASGTASVFKIEGSINDGFTVTPQNSSVTVDNVVCNYEEVEGYIDLYEVTSITFESTYNEETRTQTYTSYVVPAEVTAEYSSHFDSTQIAIIMVIPILMIIAVLLVAVRGLTRYD